MSALKDQHNNSHFANHGVIGWVSDRPSFSINFGISSFRKQERQEYNQIDLVVFLP